MTTFSLRSGWNAIRRGRNQPFKLRAWGFGRDSVNVTFESERGEDLRLSFSREEAERLIGKLEHSLAGMRKAEGQEPRDLADIQRKMNAKRDEGKA
jgi:hypothetical protein